jgi:diguanylate cyclase (GGDEF)-like protein
MNMPFMRKTIVKLTAGALLCVLMFFLQSAPSRAEVDFTRDGAADNKSLYVAGDPNGFPIESYDSDSGTYVGAAPAFLSLVSKKTGLDFCYIRTGGEDRREVLAKNNQVDLLFATGDEDKVLSLGVEKFKIFSVTQNDSITDVYCVFTSVSFENERAAVRSVADNLTKDDVALLLTADASMSSGGNGSATVLIVLGIALFCTLAALAVVLVLVFKRRPKKQTFSDSLTGLGNRERFAQMFATEISDQTREIYNVVYFAFDIAFVNNNYGNEEADAILRYAAHTISKHVKENEFCARVGGGAFAAAVNASNDVPVEKRVEEIVKELNSYGGKNLGNEGKKLFQAGICALTLEDRETEKVLYNTQQAYRRAVEEKKDYVFANRDVLKDYRAKAFIRETARDALEKHTFTPYVQFVVNSENGMICGGEVLSRWETRAFGLLNPGRYIQILQDIGLIVRHDLYMIEEACKLLDSWEKAGKNYFLNCNLTRITISDPTLVDQLLSIIGRYHFPHEKIILEVTEDSLESDKENALKNVHRLKENGFRIALDDFSNGYTTVTNLYEYAVDIVKLDRQLVLAAERDPQAASLMKEVTKLCHELQISVLAEGVETENQARQIRSVQCDYIQGYYYARALPIRELNEFEENYKAKVISLHPEPNAELIPAPAAAEPREEKAVPARCVEEAPEVRT